MERWYLGCSFEKALRVPWADTWCSRRSRASAPSGSANMSVPRKKWDEETTTRLRVAVCLHILSTIRLLYVYYIASQREASHITTMIESQEWDSPKSPQVLWGEKNMRNQQLLFIDPLHPGWTRLRHNMQPSHLASCGENFKTVTKTSCSSTNNHVITHGTAQNLIWVCLQMVYIPIFWVTLTRKIMITQCM